MPLNKGLPAAQPEFGGFPFQYGPAYGFFGDGFDGFREAKFKSGLSLHFLTDFTKIIFAAFLRWNPVSVYI